MSAEVVEYAQARVWSIPLHPNLAQISGVSLVIVTATQMGEVITTVVNTRGAIDVSLYSTSPEADEKALKAMLDRFDERVFPELRDWVALHARTPWSYLSGERAVALRMRYEAGVEPAPQVVVESEAKPLDLAAISARLTAARLKSEAP